jgi:hypothetical protein
MGVLEDERRRTPGGPHDPGARAARLRVPGWRDGRLLIGLVLVLASVALGGRVVATADRTVPVYAAGRDLATGTPLTAADVTPARVRVSGTTARYLDAARELPVGQVLARPLGVGELIPVAALVQAGALQVRPVSIPLADAPPPGATVGGRVDVWASARSPVGDGRDYLDARLIAPGVEVSRVQSDGSGLSARGAGAIQVLVPAAQLTGVLNALANEARIAVLPVPGGAPSTVTP